LDPEDYKVLIIVAGLVSYTQFGIKSRSTPLLGESSLVAEALADVRRHCEERLHNNQPEWTRGMRGVQLEAMLQRESEVPADGRHWRDERQRNNQPDKRHETGAMRGGGVMRGGGAGGQEVVAVAQQEVI
jgi:hypothetical protein